MLSTILYVSEAIVIIKGKDLTSVHAATMPCPVPTNTTAALDAHQHHSEAPQPSAAKLTFRVGLVIMVAEATDERAWMGYVEV